MSPSPELESTDRIEVVVYFDFASSLSYVAHRVMARTRGALEDAAVDLRWVPIDLTGLGPWERGNSIPEDRRVVLALTAAELGVEFQVPTIWCDSRPLASMAHRLSTDAVEEFRRSAYRRTYDQGRAIDDPEVLVELAEEFALEDVGVSEGLIESDIEAVASVSESAIEQGVRGVPTFMLGVWPLCGIHDEATMVRMLTRFARHHRAERGSAVGPLVN